MGVDGVPVDPVALIVAQPVGVQLARRDDVVPQVAVGTVVAVHGQLVGEGVEVLALLELGERRADDRRIEQPDVRRGRLIRRNLLSRRRGLGPVFAVRHVLVGQPVGLPGRGDAATDVFAFLLRRVGLDAELLHDERPTRADDHRAQQQQHHADRGNPQIAQEDGGEHRDRTDQGDGQQDQLGGQHRVDVGVAGAGERLAAAGVAEEFVPVQPVRERLEQNQRADQRDELDAGRATHRARPAGQPDAAEQVVAQQIRQQAKEGRDEQEVQHQPIERQVEGIETEVHAELRVRDTELTAVQEQLHLDPVRLPDDAREEPDEDGDADAEQPQPRHHRRAVAGHGIVGPSGGYEDRAVPVGQRQTGEHHPADQERRHHEHDQPGHQGRGEHRPIAELAEPQPVDVGVDQSGTDQQQHHHRQCQPDQNSATSSQLRHSCRRPHTHSSTPS